MPLCCNLERRRFYVVFLQVVSNPSLDVQARGVDRMFAMMRCLLELCQRVPPCMSTLLLPYDDPAVKKDVLAK